MAIFNSYVKLPEGTYVYLIFPSAAKILNGVNIPTEILPKIL